jgi:hypothetical protein
MSLKITQTNHIPDVIDSIPHDEAGGILTTITQAGSVSADDEILEMSGTANHMRKTTANLRETVNKLPVILDLTLDKKLTGLKEDQTAHQKVVAASCNDVKAAVDGLGNLIKKSQLNSKSKLPHWLEWKSLAIGSMATLLLWLPLSYFLILPAQVQAERGKDWAIAEWLNSPEGRKTRIIFQKYCQGKYPCKKLEKQQS